MDEWSTVLYMPEEDWPKAIAVADKAEVKKECRKVQAVFQLQNIAADMLQQAVDCKILKIEKTN